ncbi:hypothetical protein ACG04R_03130 [Roseateles sp. BYS78W]|uniref:Uncharacterized protein n=1 Tax=Pelomonas candidula TaxID=3299025 RepID=A0ABW7H6Y5_9BURK
MMEKTVTVAACSFPDRIKQQSSTCAAPIAKAQSINGDSSAICLVLVLR